MAVTSVNGGLQVYLSWQNIDTESSTSNTVTDEGSFLYSRTFSSGTGYGQINNIWHGVTTLTSGASQQYNMSGLAYNVFSGTFYKNFSNVRCFFLENYNSGVGENIAVRATGTVAWTNIFNGGSGDLLVGPKTPLILGNYMTGVPVSTGNNSLWINNLSNTGITIKVGVLGLI